MLIILDSSLIDAIESDIDVVHALDLIAHSRRLGKHVVLGERKVIKYLAECKLLSNSSRSIYQKIYNQLPTTKAYLDNIHIYLEISIDDVLEVVENGDVKKIRVSIKKFSDFSILDTSILLLEDMNDSNFYQIIVDYYLLSNNLSNIRIDYEPMNGGGDNTHKSFSKIQESAKRLCLCLLDNDKKAPGLDMGSTAKKVAKVNDESQPLCSLFIINAREIENLIPTFMYKETFKTDPNKLKAIKLLEQLDNSESTEARKYLDIKEGLNFKKILQDKPKTLFRVYWTNFAEEFHPVDTFKECISCNSCTKPSECICIVTPGFGKNILVEIIENYKGKDVSDLLSDELKVEWDRIGRTITAWCCASYRIV